MSGSSSSGHSYVNNFNADYVDGVYQDFLRDPTSVDEKWRYFFEGFQFAQSSSFSMANTVDDGGQKLHYDHAESQVEAYINLVRRGGHMCAFLNPLDGKPDLADGLKLARHGLEGIPADRKFYPASLPSEGPMEWSKILDTIYATYCGTIGADFRDIPTVEGILWLQNEMESCLNKPKVSQEEKLRILDCLITAEGFERFLGDRFLGQKRFSIEGLEALMPLMDSLTEDACEGGLEEICIGMAHRGRLNILANYMGKPYEAILKEFEGSESYTHDIDGDVKYHQGYSNQVVTKSGKNVRACLLPNPSHLEAVYPVVEGFTAARQMELHDLERNRVLPLLMHGDASFTGQGVVAETLNLSLLPQYTTGGTVHIILNNQVGFTTNPSDSRSGPFASDIAKMVRAPIIHVNADDPEAVVWAGELALKYRQKFKMDVVVDLIGYRRHGHNETDEPTFTQPEMYRKIKTHETVLSSYGKRLVADGFLTKEVLDAKIKDFRNKLQAALDLVRSNGYQNTHRAPKELEFCITNQKVTDEDFFARIDTTIDSKLLGELVGKLTNPPSEFRCHPKVEKLLKSRQAMIEGAGAIDWGLAELLAFGAIAAHGTYVRLSGQDCQRGTFSHRHAVINDYVSGQPYNTLSQLTKQQASVDVINSSLSEMGVLGFEFGFSVAHGRSLVLWEAQFGDFCNGAQIIIDQFLAASEAKWRQVCNLVMLLPHGYEGMGPEHSSARPERFLQLCGNNNFQVVNLTKPAQLFHVLRRQVLRTFRKPLIVLSPKSLLRHEKVVSEINEFTHGQFVEVIDDITVQKAETVRRVIFCTGKLFFELLDAKLKHSIEHIAIVRIEQLYPFPDAEVAKIFERYQSVKEVIWSQEEPSNMGYWTFVRHRIKRLTQRTIKFRYSGRKSAGTTAEGSLKSHQKEQHRIILDSLGIESDGLTLVNTAALG